MHLSRLLLPAIFLASVPVLAQDHSRAREGLGGDIRHTPDFRTPPAATDREPWRILPKAHEDDAQVLNSQNLGPDGIVVSPGERPGAAETTCYTIRAYVVARDSKHSDSTHPAGYSTCHPATRYRLKTAGGGTAMPR
ncbi:MAG TPA: hypothetical protein VFA67_17065 [Candidatus Sulfotelmatobacter sp.]|nr:hypothetical protein [Candidatus Sulfotelmatobacter sp.]